MARIKKYIPAYILFLLGMYLVLMTLFLLTRYTLWQANAAKLSTDTKLIVWKSFKSGFWFDAVVTSYILILPFLLLSLNYFLKNSYSILVRISIIFFEIILVLIVLICSADIPFFQFFNSRLTTAVHLWLANIGEMLHFLFSDKTFYPFLFAFVFGAIALILLVEKFSSLLKNEMPIIIEKKFTVISLISFIVILFTGMRGGQAIRPLGIKDAFFSNSAFVNQLTLNPVWTYFDSFSLFKLNLLSDKEALIEVQKELKIPASRYKSPISRKVAGIERTTTKNIVLVLMESMNTDKMGVFGNKRKLTPFLDSLSQHSAFFTNFYSNGIHTCNGIFATLYGFPSLLAEHPFVNIQSASLSYSGLPQILKSKGYSTLFFCTHDETFDNLGDFLPRNGIDKLFSSKHYPSNEIVNSWGVSDEFLFRYSVSKMDSLYRFGKPFLSTLLTISTHPPQQIPQKTTFKPRNTEPVDQVFEYADWAIASFMKQCQSKPWYYNTIFVFLGDHGINAPSQFQAPLALNHVPLLLFEPGNDSIVNTSDAFASQTDVFPSIMHLIGVPYINNTLGINLFTESRPYTYFCQDNKLCILNEHFYLVVDKSGTESFYEVGHKSLSDTEKQNQIYAMKRYDFSMLQVTQWMQEHALVGQE